MEGEQPNVNAGGAADGQQQPPPPPPAGLNVQAPPFPPQQDPGNVVFAAAATVHLPGFWQDRPRTWFNVCESAFALWQITSPVTKYHHVIGLILSELVESIEDMVNNYTAYVDPYEELKLRLCRHR